MRKILYFTTIIFALLSNFYFQPTTAYGDLNISRALDFLKSKQDPTGRITTGFSAPSQWASIAFAVNGIDISTIKSSDKSLKDFLLSDIPSDQASATDWENRILAIVAIGENPANFGGINYLQKLESFYNTNQIGETCSLNDDIFGLLALIASGEISNTQIKQDTLDFLIQKQDPLDGGFGFSAPGCSWYSTSADMTAAALQALQAAKDNNLTNPSLDNAIIKAATYLSSNQNPDGGFGYFGTSDPDTTGWVLMAFNSLGTEGSDQAVKAKNWLLSQQSTEDGGFLAFDYGLNTFVSNSTTTSQAITALSGKGWIIKIFTHVSPTPSISGPTPTPSISPTPIISGLTPTATPTATSTPTSTPTVTPTPTATLSISPTPPISPTPIPSTTLRAGISGPTPSPTPLIKVLGEATISSALQPRSVVNFKPIGPQPLVNGLKDNALPVSGVVGLFSVFKYLEERRWKK